MQAIATISHVLAANQDVIAEPATELGIAGFGDSSIDIEYRYWAPTASHFRTVHDVNLVVFQGFPANGISIPFPQREVRLLND